MKAIHSALAVTLIEPSKSFILMLDFKLPVAAVELVSGLVMCSSSSQDSKRSRRPFRAHGA